MPRTPQETEGITLLGSNKTQYPQGYAPEVLQTFINKHPGRDYFVKFNCPEFTSLCPITGQPDFATIYISYVPDVKMVESKSLKLWIRNTSRSGANSPPEAAYPTTPTATTAAREPCGSRPPKTGLQCTISTLRRWTTDNIYQAQKQGPFRVLF